MSAESREKAATRTPESQIRLRRADRSDLAAVVEIEKASFADPWSSASFRSALAEDRVLFLIAESASAELLGYVIAWCTVDEAELANLAVIPSARGVARMAALLEDGQVSLQQWEPNYGRLAEAQVRWEAAHGRELPTP